MGASSEQSLSIWDLPKGYSKVCPVQFLTPIVQDWRYTPWHIQQNGFAGFHGPPVSCDIVQLQPALWSIRQVGCRDGLTPEDWHDRLRRPGASGGRASADLERGR